MENHRAATTAPQQNARAAQPFAAFAPQLSFLKGGGAVHRIGEKPTASPVTGAGSLNVPIATAPPRSGFCPQLGLSYNFGTRDGPFGIGAKGLARACKKKPMTVGRATRLETGLMTNSRAQSVPSNATAPASRHSSPGLNACARLFGGGTR